MPADGIFGFVYVDKGKFIFINHSALCERLERAGRQHSQIHFLLLQRTKNIGRIGAVKARVFGNNIRIQPVFLKLAQGNEPSAETCRIISRNPAIANVSETSYFLALGSLDEQDAVGV